MRTTQAAFISGHAVDLADLSNRSSGKWSALVQSFTQRNIQVTGCSLSCCPVSFGRSFTTLAQNSLCIEHKTLPELLSTTNVELVDTKRKLALAKKVLFFSPFLTSFFCFI